MTGSMVRTCVTTPILDTLHFSVNGPSRHAANGAGLPVNDLAGAADQPAQFADVAELTEGQDRADRLLGFAGRQHRRGAGAELAREFRGTQGPLRLRPRPRAAP